MLANGKELQKILRAITAASASKKREESHRGMKSDLCYDFAQDLCYVPTEINRADPLTKPSTPVSMFLCGVYPATDSDWNSLMDEEDTQYVRYAFW